ncbi:hypothetical protein [Leptothoe spongobia]|uniref:Methyltransferase FkbM domain-containing protein n=1 Tax=Leptothoe spongobia TAU-MAC 1115 TaxID=1967444 RepID=A0A947DE06_9CYAN|nr:hypothetical protein [Leptothoe spongobia]MBT9315241.1 hypothetical protein [Leptothoe spongobia TAU-MAC 1115]
MKLKEWIFTIYSYLPIIREIRQIRDTLRGIYTEIASLKSIEIVRLFDFQLSKHSRYGDPKRLHRYAFQINSQNQEDGMIAEIFNRIGIKKHIFAEIGIGDGHENNTAFLISQGWHGFWIDSSNVVSQTLQSKPNIKKLVKLSVAFVSKENIKTIFEQLEVPIEIDLLSIDVDQNTYYIWESLDKYKPRVVVIEYNSLLPPYIEWKVEYNSDKVWDCSQNFGGSLKAFENLGKKLGYSLIGCDFSGTNAFFVRKDLVTDKFATPFTAENHYEPPRYKIDVKRGHKSQILDSF